MYKGSKLLLKAPAFDLAWLEDARAPESAKGCDPDPVLLCPSGGGQAKTGVKNQLQILRPLNDLSYLNYQGFETDGTSVEGSGSGICSSVSIGAIRDGSRLICTLIDDKCLLTRLTRDPLYTKPESSAPSSSSKNNEYVSSRAPLPSSGLKFSKVAEFKADHHDSNAGVRSCCFTRLTNIECEGELCTRKVQDVLITGGNDGCLRIWSIEPKEDDVFTFPLLSTLKGHRGAILKVNAHPSRNWVASASDDGSFKVWDILGGTALLTVACPQQGTATGLLSCMDVAFAQGLDAPPELPSREDESMYMYSLQSPKKGPALVVKWRVVATETTEAKASGSETNGTKSLNASNDSDHAKGTGRGATVVMRASQEAAQVVCSGPAKRLAVSTTGLFVACGCSDGSVFVLSAPTMRKYSRHVCHDLPVTGLAFSPDCVAVMHDVPAVLLSVSADCRVAAIPLGGVSPWAQTASNVLIALIAIALMLLSIALLSGYALPTLRIL